MPEMADFYVNANEDDNCAIYNGNGSYTIRDGMQSMTIPYIHNPNKITASLDLEPYIEKIVRKLLEQEGYIVGQLPKD